MIKLSRIPLCLFLLLAMMAIPASIGWSEEPVDFNDLTTIDCLDYKVGSEQPFTGVAIFRGYHGVWTEQEYFEGKWDGKSVSWDANGQKLAESEYYEGKQEGKLIIWHETGEKAAEVYYENDQRKKHTQFHLNGQKAWEGEYKDGESHGKWIEWYESGEKRAESEYRDGELISKKFWNKQGNPSECISNTVDVIKHDPDSNFSGEASDLAFLEEVEGILYRRYPDSIFTGKIILYEISTGERMVVTDSTNNDPTKWLFEADYLNGKKHGKCIAWYDNGQKRTEIEYHEGKVISRICWDEHGSPIECE